MQHSSSVSHWKICSLFHVNVLLCVHVVGADETVLITAELPNFCMESYDNMQQFF